MAHIREFDFRHSWTFETLQTLDHGIQKLVADQLDGLDLLEHLEDVVGLAFVALQTYITGTEAHLRAVFPAATLNSRDVRSQNCDATSGVRYVEAIWAAGNYYKHHDQWPDWQPNGARAETIISLGKLGISEATEFPCVEVKKALNAETLPLADLLAVVSDWREAWLSHLRTAALPNRAAAMRRRASVDFDRPRLSRGVRLVDHDRNGEASRQHPLSRITRGSGRG